MLKMFHEICIIVKRRYIERKLLVAPPRGHSRTSVPFSNPSSVAVESSSAPSHLSRRRAGQNETRTKVVGTIRQDRFSNKKKISCRALVSLDCFFQFPPKNSGAHWRGLPAWFCVLLWVFFKSLRLDNQTPPVSEPSFSLLITNTYVYAHIDEISAGI